MTIDWKALAPHRPVPPGDQGYVERPGYGGNRIAAMILSGQATVLLAGPLGVGKSTELARAADVLRRSRVACLVQLGMDRGENMHSVTEEQVLLHLAGSVAHVAIEGFGIDLSPELRMGLVARGALPSELLGGAGGSVLSGSAGTIASATLDEVARKSQRAVTLLIDGLEKTPEEPARRVFDALSRLPDHAEIVLVVPSDATFGPAAKEVVRPGEKLMVLRPLEVESEAGAAGRKFLARIVAQRLELAVDAFDEEVSATRVRLRALGVGVPAHMPVLLASAAAWSGGVPRTFLQLVADAATNANLDRGDEWPLQEDLAAAVHDQIEMVRRLLLPGDADAVRVAHGTDGRELALAAKLRLVRNAILVERARGRGMRLVMHPFARELLGPAVTDA